MQENQKNKLQDNKNEWLGNQNKTQEESAEKPQRKKKNFKVAVTKLSAPQGSAKKDKTSVLEKKYTGKFSSSEQSENYTKKTGKSTEKSYAQKNAKPGHKPALADKKKAPDLKKGCPYAKDCGGCAYQGVPYADQLKEKEANVKALFKGICDVAPIEGMEEPLYYRNKVHAVMGRKKDGTVISGVYEEHSHRVVNVDSCLIEDQIADSIIRDIRDLCKSFKITIYNEKSGYGLLRHVLIRRGFTSEEVMVVLVTTSSILPSKNNFVKALRKNHPEITTVVLNVNDKDTTMVLGKRDVVLYGKGFIMDTLCGHQFKISPQSFYQINPVQTEKLYEKAISLAGLTGKEKVIDAYCGIGTIGLIASDQAKEVMGVELNKDAVKDAIANAKCNKNHNVKFYAADAGDFMVDMAEDGEHVDVVFMDPPRSGSTEKFLSSLKILGPSRVVYISCNPETMVRDIRFLKKLGYSTNKIWPYDLFPYTSHVEAVTVLNKIK